MGELSQDEQDVRDRFAARLARPDAIDAYAALPATLGGKILDVDLARELSDDYAASIESRRRFTIATHEPAAAFIKRQYLGRLAQPATGPVLFLAGGGGSGKTTVRDSIARPLVARAEIVRDGVMRSYGHAVAVIDDALLSGRQIEVAYVHTPFREAARRAQARAATSGRAIPMDVLAEAHAGAQATLLRLADHYHDNGNVTLHVFDNSGTAPLRSSVEAVAARRYNRPDETLEQTVARLIEELSQ